MVGTLRQRSLTIGLLLRNYQLPMNVNFILAAFFGLLALIFLVLSITSDTSIRRRARRRIGVIFATVALMIIAIYKLI